MDVYTKADETVRKTLFLLGSDEEEVDNFVYSNFVWAAFMINVDETVRETLFLLARSAEQKGRQFRVQYLCLDCLYDYRGRDFQENLVFTRAQ